MNHVQVNSPAALFVPRQDVTVNLRSTICNQVLQRSHRDDCVVF